MRKSRMTTGRLMVAVAIAGILLWVAVSLRSGYEINRLKARVADARRLFEEGRITGHDYIDRSRELAEGERYGSVETATRVASAERHCRRVWAVYETEVRVIGTCCRCGDEESIEAQQALREAFVFLARERRP